MEILLAALLPPLAVLLLAQRASDDTRRAFRLFAALTTLWLLPCWITLSTNAPLDYLTGEPPWTSLRPAGYLNKNFLLNDVVLQLLPLREAARTSLAAGEPPFLNRYAGAGSPLWENLQLALLYPVNVVGLPFSSFAWPLFSASAKLLLAACGMYLFLRRIGATHGGAIVGAIAYAFCAFSVAFLLFPVTNVTALLPLLLLTIRHVAEKATPRTIAAAVGVTWSVLVGGHPESVLHVALVAVPYGLLVAGSWFLDRQQPATRNQQPIRTLALVATLALLLASPILVPFAYYAPHSERMATLARTEHFLATAPFAAESFAPFLVPNYFGNPRVHNYRHAINFNELCTQYAGLATLILAVAGARRRNAFWIAVFVVALLLAIMPGPVIDVVKHIPLLNITANGRMRFVLAFAMAVLAAFGFEEVRRARVAAIAIGVAVVAVCLLSFPIFVQYGIRRLVFFTELAALASAAAIALGRMRLVPLLLFFDLASVMALYNPATSRALYYPRVAPIAAMQRGERPYRVVGIDKALIPSSATMFALEDIRPHDPLAFAPYVDYLLARGLVRDEYFPRFQQMPPDDVLERLGVRYVLEGERVRELPPRPRYPGQLVRYGPNGATLRLSGPAIVETGELALPGWRLTRDGKPWPLHAKTPPFLSWNIPPGEATYTLRYVPQGLGWGLLFAAAGLIGTIGWCSVLSARSSGDSDAAALSTEHRGLSTVSQANAMIPSRQSL